MIFKRELSQCSYRNKYDKKQGGGFLNCEILNLYLLPIAQKHLSHPECLCLTFYNTLIPVSFSHMSLVLGLFLHKYIYIYISKI